MARICRVTPRWITTRYSVGACCEKGTDEYPLDPKPSVAFHCKALGRPLRWWEKACPEVPYVDLGAANETLETEIIARSDGELFLYVNDAVFFPPWMNLFYSNNSGSAQVTVQRLPPSASDAPGDAQPPLVRP